MTNSHSISSFNFVLSICSRTDFQFRYHILLAVVANRLVEEQPFGQMVLVVAFEDVLLLQEAKQDHRLVKDALNLLFGHPFDALLQLVIDEERKVFGRFRVQVEEVFEIGRYLLLEYLVAVERLVEESVETIFQIQQTLRCVDIL